MNRRSITTLLAMGCVIVTLTACVYRMDVPQGNRIEPEVLEQLELGMSKNQVEFLLGTPAVVDLYHPDRWYYIFYFKSGEDGKVLQRSMSLSFDNDLLVNIEGSLNPF